jgi:hypothetical protein
MFRRNSFSSKDKAKTPILQLIQSDVIGPMQTHTIQGDSYIIMFTDDYASYTEVYFMTLKTGAPAKFKECVARVQKQLSKSKVCRVIVDEAEEYGSRENFI